MMNLLQLLRRYLSILALIFIASSALTACKSVTSSDTVDYKTAGAARGPNAGRSAKQNKSVALSLKRACPFSHSIMIAS